MVWDMKIARDIESFRERLGTLGGFRTVYKLERGRNTKSGSNLPEKEVRDCLCSLVRG